MRFLQNECQSDCFTTIPRFRAEAKRKVFALAELEACATGRVLTTQLTRRCSNAIYHEGKDFRVIRRKKAKDVASIPFYLRRQDSLGVVVIRLKLPCRRVDLERNSFSP